MTPAEIGFLSDIDKSLSDLRMMILDRIMSDIDTDARNRPLQDYVYEVMKKINHLQRLGFETVSGDVMEREPVDEPFDWDVQKECRIISVDGGSVYVEWEGSDGCDLGQQFRYDTSTLGIEPRYGGIKRPDGSTYKGWSFCFVSGQTEDNRDIFQFCGEGTRGWICINTTIGVTRFVPRPVDQQDYS